MCNATLQSYEYGRVKTAIKFMSAVCIGYTLMAWGILNLFPEFFIKIFNQDTSNFIGGLACFVTMLIVVLPELKKDKNKCI